MQLSDSGSGCESEPLASTLSLVEIGGGGEEDGEREPPLPLEMHDPGDLKNELSIIKSDEENCPSPEATSDGNVVGGKCLESLMIAQANGTQSQGRSITSEGGGRNDGVRSSSKKSGVKLLVPAEFLRRSPRLVEIMGERDNAGLVLARISGKSDKNKGRFSGNEKRGAFLTPVKSRRWDCQKLTSKAIISNAKRLEEKSLWRNQNISSVQSMAESNYAIVGPSSIAWAEKDSVDGRASRCSNPWSIAGKQLRRSPRFMGNGETEGYRGSNRKGKSVSCKRPPRSSTGLVKGAQNGYPSDSLKETEANDIGSSGERQLRKFSKLGSTYGNGSVGEASRKYDNDPPGVPYEKKATKSIDLVVRDGSNQSLAISPSHFVSSHETVLSPSELVQVTKDTDSDDAVGKSDKHELTSSVDQLSARSVHLNKTCNDRDSYVCSEKPDERFQEGLHMGKFSISSLSYALDEAIGLICTVEAADLSDGQHTKKRKMLDHLHTTTLVETSSRQSAVTAAAVLDTNDELVASNFIESYKTVEEEHRKKIHHADRSKAGKSTSFFIGDPIPSEEAQERWRWRYEMKNQRSKRNWEADDDEDMIVSNVECHYSQAKVNGSIFGLGDCAYIRGEGAQRLIGKIVEFFKTTDDEDYFRVQWFYRPEDTVIQRQAAFHDRRRLFYSNVMNDNPIDCIISKVSISQVSPKVAAKPKSAAKTKSTRSDFYFDMEYCVEYSTFQTLKSDKPFNSNDLSLQFGNVIDESASAGSLLQNKAEHEICKKELVLLDLYSGCGGMSAGLCLGAKVSGVDLVTRWAVDMDRAACESLKLNHPETHVRTAATQDYLAMLKEWQKLCKRYVFSERTVQSRVLASTEPREEIGASDDDDIKPGEFEVGKLVDICYGDPNKTGKPGLKFKVRWKGYDASEDTWEPVEGLRNCQERICDFVRNGFKSKMLPLPGDVDVICGGPPCQGISGYNRYRNIHSPLDDERNRQIIVFMDVVEFLKPKFVLMENVVDILRLDKGSLGRYALSRLIHMKYQARLGIMAAGCYGLPQFRLRIFLWGACPSEKLPQFPLPTHDVIVRYWSPPEFERNVVAYDEGQLPNLEKALLLGDAISDLPPVTNDEDQDEMPYKNPPETEFQGYIRSNKYEMTGSGLNSPKERNPLLYDHRTYRLHEDDYLRVCRIPKRKGANFRDLPGLIVGFDGVVHRGPAKEQVKLPSGKSLLPDYVFTFEQGRSKKPFARLWWDETVPTVLTFPTAHSQAALHPEQDRILTVREYARLQGFPDYYRFRGTVKERYCQVGNAVAVPVARALGYALGMAYQNLTGDEPLLKLPPKFSHSNYHQLTQLSNDVD